VQDRVVKMLAEVTAMQLLRHMADIEAIHTFEGTETMQALIVGRDITGIGAFR
jgi:alkylation response protein AidB-like acyl-CoA dehydrogenase